MIVICLYGYLVILEHPHGLFDSLIKYNTDEKL